MRKLIYSLSLSIVMLSMVSCFADKSAESSQQEVSGFSVATEPTVQEINIPFTDEVIELLYENYLKQTKSYCTTIGTMEQYEEWLKSTADDVFILEFHASWCGPCKMLAPIMTSLYYHNKQCHFAKVDVDVLPDLAKKLGVVSIPTVFIGLHGHWRFKFVGIQKEWVYQESIDTLYM